MNATPGLPRMPGRLFYGWWLVLAGLMVTSLPSIFPFSAFFLPIQNELQTSRAGLALAFSLSQIEVGITSPLNGYLIGRFGPRRMMSIGYVFFGCGFMLISQVESLFAFYAAYIFMAFGAAMCGFLPVSATILNWFSRRRATALGLAQSGEGFGGLFVPILVLAIATFGWRTTALAIGPFIIVVGLLLASLFRTRPEDHGLRPDGDPPIETQFAANALQPSQTAVEEEPSMSPREALRSQGFWLISAAHAVTLVYISAVLVHQIPALVAVGLSQQSAAFVFAVSTGSVMVGRIIMGFIGDRVDHRYALAGMFLTHTIAAIILAYVSNIYMALAFAVLHGLAWGGRAPLFIAIRGDFFGRKNFATIMGMSQSVLMGGTIIGPVFAGWVYDVSNSYSFSFLIMAVINFLSIGLILAARKPALMRKPLPTV